MAECPCAVGMRGWPPWVEGGEKWSDFRLILEAAPTGFVGRVDVGCMQEKSGLTGEVEVATGTGKAEGERLSEGGLLGS